MKIRLASVPVKDQAHALKFYTEILGFRIRDDIPLGEFRWLTVVSAQEPDAAALLLEPDAHDATKNYQSALYEARIPAASLESDDIAAEYGRLSALDVRFLSEPFDAGGSKLAVFDDTCGNYIQIYEVTSG